MHEIFHFMITVSIFLFTNVKLSFTYYFFIITIQDERPSSSQLKFIVTQQSFSAPIARVQLLTVPKSSIPSRVSWGYLNWVEREFMRSLDGHNMCELLSTLSYA